MNEAYACDDCITAAADETFIEDRDTLIRLCITIGNELPDHVCLEPEKCMCTCH